MQTAYGQTDTSQSGSLAACLGILEQFPSGLEEEAQAVVGAVQTERAPQEHGDQHVRRDHGEVDHLPAGPSGSVMSTPDTGAERFEGLERLIRYAKQTEVLTHVTLGLSRFMSYMGQTKFVSLIDFICSKSSFSFAHINGVMV